MNIEGLEKRWIFRHCQSLSMARGVVKYFRQIAWRKFVHVTGETERFERRDNKGGGGEIDEEGRTIEGKEYVVKFMRRNFK